MGKTGPEIPISIDYGATFLKRGFCLTEEGAKAIGNNIGEGNTIIANPSKGVVVNGEQILPPEEAFERIE